MKKKRIPLSVIKQAWLRPVLWCHTMITLLNNGPLGVIGTYTPTIVSSFGFDPLRSNALASVGLWISLLVAAGYSYMSDRFQLRGETTLLTLVLNLAFSASLRAVASSDDKQTRFAILTLNRVSDFAPHYLNVAWMALNTHSAEERSIAMAMIIMSANVAGIYGSQLLRSADAPRYPRGLSAIVGFVAGALLFCLMLLIYERFIKKPEQPTDEGSVTPNSEASDEKA